MTQYINKAVIVAEIKRLMRHSQESKQEFVDIGYNQNAFAEDCRIVSFNKILSFLDTLEVKEVQEEPYIMGDIGNYTTTTK